MLEDACRRTAPNIVPARRRPIAPARRAGLGRVARVVLVLFAGAVLLGAPTRSARADVPGQVSFQGLLLDAAGQPMTGTANMTFSLFAAATGGSALWTEAHPATAVTSGVYDVTLGATTPLTPALLAGTTRWLEVVVNGETLTPRRQLLTVPYAITAKTLPSLDALNGIPCKAQTPAAGTLTITFGLNGVVSMACGPLFTLTVSTTGGAGNPTPPVVTSNPAGISCNGFNATDCTEPYLGGTVVTLTTGNNALYLFTGWSGACTGTGACIVTMDAAKSVIANYQLQL